MKGIVARKNLKPNRHTGKIENEITLKILYVNIQSLNSKVAYFKSLEEKADALCLCEHWMPQKQIEQVNLEFWFLASNYSRTESKHGGACIFLSNNWRDKYKERLDLMAKNCDFNFEIGAVELLPLNTIILCSYRSPSNGDRLIFLEYLNWVLNRVALEGKKLILAGDFNFNFLVAKDSKLLADLLLSYKLCQTVGVPTRITPTCSSCLDNVVTNLKYRDVKVFETGLSDHLAIRVTTIVSAVDHSRVARSMKRDVTKRSIENFCSILSTLNWQTIYNGSDMDINSLFEYFITRFQTAFDLACPFKLQRNRRVPVAPNIKLLFSKMRDVNVLISNCSDVLLKARLRRKHKTLKRRLEETIKKNNDVRIKSSSNIGRGAWNLIKENVHMKPTRSGPTKLLVEGAKITDPKELAENFLQHFTKLPCPKGNSLNPTDLMKVGADSPVNSLVLSPTTLEELTKFFSKIKNSKSEDFFGISVSILKKCWILVGPIVTHLVNVCLERGVFPDCLKASEIVPVEKKGDKSDVKNWRAISICPVISKLIEKVVCDRLLSFLTRNNVLSPKQFGFRKSMGTNDALYSFISALYSNLNDKNVAGGIFCDLSRAFEVVPHNVLIDKLHYYGIRGLPLSLISSYLQGRTQRVRLTSTLNGERVYSEWGKVEKGVPAGSVLGPLLFIIFVNDLPAYLAKICELLFSIDVTLFADDTSLLVAGPRNVDLANISKEALKKAQNWFDANKLCLNSNKTVCINFGKNCVSNDIFSNDSTKFLGLTINRTLSWSDHVDMLCSKIMSGIYLLRNLANKVNIDTLKLVYHASVEAHFSYGIIFWYGSPNYLTEKLFIVQKKAVRVMFKLHYRAHCKQYFLDHNIMTLPALYLYHLLLFVRKNMNLYSVRESRDGRILDGLRVNNERFRCSPQYRGITAFNNLERGIRDETNFSKFKNSLRRSLITTAPYTLMPNRLYVT